MAASYSLLALWIALFRKRCKPNPAKSSQNKRLEFGLQNRITTRISTVMTGNTASGASETATSPERITGNANPSTEVADVSSSNIAVTEKEFGSLVTLPTSNRRISAPSVPTGRISTGKQRSRSHTSSSVDSPNFSSANAMAEGILKQAAESSNGCLANPGNCL